MQIRPSYQQGFATHQLSKVPQLWKDAVGVWAPFLGITGKELFDWSGCKNQGVNGADWITDNGEYVLSFDQTATSKVIGTLRPNFNNVKKISMAIWFRAGVLNVGASQDYIFSLPNSNIPTLNGVDIRQTQDIVGVDLVTSADNSFFNVAIQLPDLLWHLFGLTYDGVTLEGFFDGLPFGTDTVTVGTGISHSSGQFQLGTNFDDPVTWGWQGNIASPIIWNRDIAPAEHLQYYLNTHMMFEQIAYLPIFTPVVANVFPIFQPRDIHSQVFGGQVIQ